MAPMTRGRSGHERIPNEMNFEYYTARASAGMIITEGVSFSPYSHGWAQSAAIETDEQMAAWKKIVDAVHEKGGLMCIQLWHTGKKFSSVSLDRVAFSCAAGCSAYISNC
jgi:N-ethylmaleimide reductase